MIFSDYARKVKSNIIGLGITENEINLFYFINENRLQICNEYVVVHNYVNFSLTNFKQILSFIKNDDEFKNSSASNKIKNFEIYL